MIYDVDRDLIWANILPSPSLKRFVKESEAPEQLARWQIKFTEQHLHGIRWEYNPQNMKNARILLRYIAQNFQNGRFFTKGEYKANMLTKVLKVPVENLEDALPTGVLDRLHIPTNWPRVTKCWFDHKAICSTKMKHECSVIKAQCYGMLYAMLKNE